MTPEELQDYFDQFIVRERAKDLKIPRVSPRPSPMANVPAYEWQGSIPLGKGELGGEVIPPGQRGFAPSLNDGRATVFLPKNVSPQTEIHEFEGHVPTTQSGEFFKNEPAWDVKNKSLKKDAQGKIVYEDRYQGHDEPLQKLWDKHRAVGKDEGHMRSEFQASLFHELKKAREQYPQYFDKTQSLYMHPDSPSDLKLSETLSELNAIERTSKIPLEVMFPKTFTPATKKIVGRLVGPSTIMYDPKDPVPFSTSDQAAGGRYRR